MVINALTSSNHSKNPGQHAADFAMLFEKEEVHAVFHSPDVQEWMEQWMKVYHMKKFSFFGPLIT